MQDQIILKLSQKTKTIVLLTLMLLCWSCTDFGCLAQDDSGGDDFGSESGGADPNDQTADSDPNTLTGENDEEMRRIIESSDNTGISVA